MRSRILIPVLVSSLISGILIGCGGGDSASVQSTDSGTTPAPAAPGAPATPSPGGTSPAAIGEGYSTAVSPPPVNSSSSPSTPDAAFKEWYVALNTLEFGKLWDTLPGRYQTGINELFQEFGKQVDQELWDKSFNLLTRYVSVMQTKQEMVYATPEAQATMGMLQMSAGQFGAAESDLSSPEKMKEFSAPLNKSLLTILNSELSKTKRLKSFDGRVFMAKTVEPVAQNLKELGKLVLAELPETNANGEIPGFRTMEKYLESDESIKNMQVTLKETKDDLAVVEGTVDGVKNEYNMRLVDGKWMSNDFASNIEMMLGLAKLQIPMIAQQINSTKDRVLPALKEIEPLIVNLQKANTQDDFNVAYAEFNSQAPQLIANAVGMPGLSAMMGGGLVQVTPVTIELSQDLPEDQLGKLIEELESFTDEPAKTISLPKRSGGSLTIEMTPVPDPQAFSDKIASGSQLAESVEFDPRRRTIRVGVNPPPSEPETSESEPETP